MLVLSRKKNEIIYIQDDIKIIILDSNNSSVKMGFIAPKEIKILRHEVFFRNENHDQFSNELMWGKL